MNKLASYLQEEKQSKRKGVLYHKDYIEERFAINEFNALHEQRKFCPVYHLICKRNIEQWYHQIFVLHLFRNKYCNNFVGVDV
jgi:hypothetical protein